MEKSSLEKVKEGEDEEESPLSDSKSRWEGVRKWTGSCEKLRMESAQLTRRIIRVTWSFLLSSLNNFIQIFLLTFYCENVEVWLLNRVRIVTQRSQNQVEEFISACSSKLIGKYLGGLSNYLLIIFFSPKLRLWMFWQEAPKR